jgi:subtilase family serine protease
MSKNLQFYPFAVRWLCCCSLTFGLTSALLAQPRNVPAARVLISGPIDAKRLHTLAGNTRGEANAQNDRGKVPDTFAIDHMLLQLQRSPEREQAFRDFIDQQHDSASPNFHKWLTAAQIGQLYGPAPEDIEMVSDWLRSNGFTVNTVYPSGMSIDFSGMAGQVSAAFSTEIHRLSVNGQDHIANMSDPQIPEALSRVIGGIVSLHDFRPRSMKMPGPKYRIEFEIVVPADLATIYNLKAAFAAGYTGQGQTIAVIESSDLYNTADWQAFRRVFGLASYTSGSLVTINPAAKGSSNCSDPGANGADDEASLDAEWASAAAPDATIQVATCADTATTPGFVIATQNLINSSDPPKVISVSYGFCEAETGVAANAAYNTAYQQAAAEGISVFVSAGDAGAAACDRDLSAAIHGIGVSSSSSTPYNVAVGGTDFADTSQHTRSTYWGATNSSTYGSALSYVPEIPWNDSCAGSVLAGFFGYSVGYGPSGYCGSSLAQESGTLTTGAGGGGPSGCATGVPAQNLVVGGSCKGYPKPSWQTGVPGIPNDGVRDVPDVSLFAANGVWGHYYVFCFSDPNNGGVPCVGSPGNWAGAGGTSFSSPILAGIQALVNQKMGASQGNPNPVYYKLAASSVASSVFHSITTGDIAVNCSGEISCFGSAFEGRGRSTPSTGFDGNGGLSTSSQTYTPAFGAASGWNFATGLGSVDAYNLILNWTKGQ